MGLLACGTRQMASAWCHTGPSGASPASPAPLLREDQRAVSAVIGTILILAITVLGIAGVMAYGAPTIDRMQAQNAQSAIEGNFEGLRDSIMELSVPDHARTPSVQLASGTLGLQAGERIMVTANHDGSYTGCDFHVTGWTDSGAAKHQVAVSAAGPCRTPLVACIYPMAAGTACLEIHAVAGSTLTKQTVAFDGATATVVGADFSKGDWLFRLTDANISPTVYTEAWLHTSDQIYWTRVSSTGRYDVYFDAGAVFSQRGGTYFLEKEAPIGDATYGTGYYGLWLRTLVVPNGNYVSTDDERAHTVALTLLGVAPRVDEDATYKLRIDVAGPLSESWCKSLLLRNIKFGTPASAAYANDASFPCTNSDAAAIRSVTYSCLTCDGAAHPFTFRFLHARIATTLAS